MKKITARIILPEREIKVNQFLEQIFDFQLIIRSWRKRRERGVRGMDITISGTPEEIAALVLAVQGRRKQEIKLEVDEHRVSEAVNHGLNLPDLTAP